MERRLAELDREAQITALPPVVLGGVLVVPLGLLAKMSGRPLSEEERRVVDKQKVAAAARAIVMDVERRLGCTPVNREEEKLGYDIESRDPARGISGSSR